MARGAVVMMLLLTLGCLDTINTGGLLVISILRIRYVRLRYNIIHNTEHKA